MDRMDKHDVGHWGGPPKGGPSPYAHVGHVQRTCPRCPWSLKIGKICGKGLISSTWSFVGWTWVGWADNQDNADNQVVYIT